MACSECKKRSNIRDEIIQSSKSVEKRIVWFVIIWSIFGAYGLYCLITNLI